MEPLLGEIRMFAGDFAPAGWSFCDGRLLSISENEALFTLLGTSYGGDGQTTFGLPDLRGRVPLHRSASTPLGSMGGTETVTLLPNQMAAHTHQAMATSANGNVASPSNALWAASGYRCYATAAPTTALGSMSPAGGTQPHENLMPSVAITFIIALFGIYPTFN